MFSLTIGRSLQRELNDMGSLEHAITQTSNLLYESVRRWGIQVLNSPAKNDPENGVFYKKNNTGLPEILRKGYFAKPADANKIAKLDDSMATALEVAAVNYLWQQAGVYIVQMPVDKAFGPGGKKKPCDFKINLNDLFRVCDKENAYFFIKKTSKHPSEKYPKVDGVDDLDKWNLEPIPFAESAMRTQEKHGYNAKFHADWVKKSLFSKVSPKKKNYHATLPVCKLYELKDHWPRTGTTMNCMGAEVSPKFFFTFFSL